MYRLFIDEVGNSDLESSETVPNERYLSLTGVIVELGYHDGEFSETLRALKRDIFGSDGVSLHRRELSRREGAFTALRDESTRQRFDDGLLTLLKALNYRVITIVIDKLEHKERYRVWRYHPYHYCLTVMLERYIMHLHDQGANGDVMAESRERGDNEKLSNSYQYFYKFGSDRIGSDRTKLILTSKELKIKRKEANIAGLQVADLLAHPSFRWVQAQRLRTPMTAPFGLRIIEILKVGKYLCDPRGNVKGWGCKWLP